MDSLPEDEQRSYSQHRKDLSNDASRILTLKIDAEDRAKKVREREIAIGLLRKGVSVDIIAEATGLSKDEIEKL